MGMDTAHLAPDSSEKLSSFRNLGVKNSFNSLAVSHAVFERADAAYSFYNVLIIVKISFFRKIFKASVNESDGGDSLNNFLILKNKVKVNRLRQHGMLGTKRNY